MRTQEDLTELLDHLNSRVKIWSIYQSLMDGGCCFCASVIASCLEDLRINYTVTVYSLSNSQDIYQIVKNDDLIHMSITTRVGGKVFEIGDPIGEHHMRKHNIHKFTCDLNSDELMEIYNNNNWNGEWDTSKNEDFKDDIELLFQMVA